LSQLEFVCLANSRKTGGRCVAGITRSGDWVRPVSPVADGTLFWPRYILDDGSAAAVLDIVQLEVARARPEPHQPENWEVTDAPWRHRGRLESAQAGAFLRDHAIVGPDLLSNCGDRVRHQYLVEHPGASSLCIVKPAEFLWRITSVNGKRQTRASFVLAGTRYDLSVTDPIWEARLRDLPRGVYERAAADIAPEGEVFLTVSLSEPFQDNCYKLVAAVIAL
jgi:hypothetical protein